MDRRSRHVQARPQAKRGMVVKMEWIVFEDLELVVAEASSRD
jgi:hypothetical protein